MYTHIKECDPTPYRLSYGSLIFAVTSAAKYGQRSADILMDRPGHRNSLTVMGIHRMLHETCAKPRQYYMCYFELKCSITICPIMNRSVATRTLMYSNSCKPKCYSFRFTILYSMKRKLCDIIPRNKSSSS
jgi:hypothetical protein